MFGQFQVVDKLDRRKDCRKIHMLSTTLATSRNVSMAPCGERPPPVNAHAHDVKMSRLSLHRTYI
jgi:hypothetical protein